MFRQIGTVGFCLGGRLAYLSATRTKADAAVGYYGVMLTEHLNETINAPLVLHVATEDEYMPKEQQDKMQAGLAGNDKVMIYVYEGQSHAFARTGGEHFDQASADAASERTLDHFRVHLG